MSNTGIIEVPVRTAFTNFSDLVDWAVGDHDFCYSYADRDQHDLARELVERLKHAVPDDDDDDPGDRAVEVTPLYLAGFIIEEGKAQREELHMEAEYEACEDAEWVRQELIRQGLDEAFVDLDMEYALTFKDNGQGMKEPVDVIRRSVHNIRVNDDEVAGTKELSDIIYRFLTEEAIPESIKCGLWPDPGYNYWSNVEIRAPGEQ